MTIRIRYTTNADAGKIRIIDTLSTTPRYLTFKIQSSSPPPFAVGHDAVLLERIPGYSHCTLVPEPAKSAVGLDSVAETANKVAVLDLTGQTVMAVC